MNDRRIIFLIMIALAAAAVLLLAPTFGMEKIAFGDILGGRLDEARAAILWKIRVPRVLAAFLAGAALAVSGMVFQAMFRNPLATPFTLGVSSGAAFGASLYVRVGVYFSFLTIPGQSVSALLWAVIAILIVYGLTRARKGFTTATMLVAGVAVNFLFSSIILFLQYMSDFTDSFRIIRWLMGGLEIVGYSPVLSLLIFVAAGTALVAMNTRELNLLTLGEEIAMSRGVDAGRTKLILFFATSIMVGGVVSICGPIGFIGMMVPHICRLVTGWDHRYLMPAAFMFGGAFLVFCDTLARTLISPAEIPVGIITSLLGGPFFLWLLLAGLSEEGVVTRSRARGSSDAGK